MPAHPPILFVVTPTRPQGLCLEVIGERDESVDPWATATAYVTVDEAGNPLHGAKIPRSD